MTGGRLVSRLRKFFMPDIVLSPVPLAEKGLFSRHFQDYLGELSRWNGAKPNRRGLYEYRQLDRYWGEPTRRPFFIEDAGRRVGLLLLRELSGGESPEGGPSLQVAEICVFRRHRRRGIAREVMRAVAREAEERGLPVTWSAYMSNGPANELYRSILREFGSMDGRWETSQTRGIDSSGLARHYYAMTPAARP